MGYLLRGVFIGLLFGVPAGAVGALTVQRSWSRGIKAGLLTGLGSSVADCFYASVGAFGLTLISDFLMRWQSIISFLGGALILVMGIGLILSKKGTADSIENAKENAGLFFSSFVIGITNPAAILTFLFAFSMFDISEIQTMADGAMLVTGVFFGTYFWWGSLTGVTQIVKRRSTCFRIETMNHVFGVILCVFGGVVIFRIFL